MQHLVVGCTVLACALVSGVARAQAGAEGQFGLGVIVGDPTGASGKYVLSPDNAIDGAVGLGLIGGSHLSVHADLLWQFELERWPALSADLYLGLGPKLASKAKRGKGGVRFGARGPLGVSLCFTRAPFDVFAEVAAGLWLVDKVGLDVDAAIGGRYWF